MNAMPVIARCSRYVMGVMISCGKLELMSSLEIGVEDRVVVLMKDK
jgi:hypothetical protein